MSSNFTELKSSVKTWTNDQESLLLDKLKNFTSNYINQVNLIEATLHQFDNSLQRVEVNYFNTLNYLKTMSIDKFLEHSISNDTLDFKKQKEIPEVKSIFSKEEKEDQLVKKFKQAITLSCENLNIKDLIDVGNDQNDDNISVTGSKLMSNINKQNKLGVKLPLIIGQDAFFTKNYCGVVFEDNDLKNEDDKSKSFLTTIPTFTNTNQNNNNSQGGKVIRESELYNADDGKKITDLEHDNNIDKFDDKASIYSKSSTLYQVPSHYYNQKATSNLDKITRQNANTNNPTNPTNLTNLNNNQNSNQINNNFQFSNQIQQTTNTIPNVDLISTRTSLPQIAPLKDINLGQKVIVNNTNKMVPKVPVIAIPVPKPKPKIDQVEKEKNQPIEDKKPEKIDFKQELFRKMQGRGAADTDKKNNEENVGTIDNEIKATSKLKQFNHSNTYLPNQNNNPTQGGLKFTEKNEETKKPNIITTNIANRRKLLDDDDEEGGLFDKVDLPDKKRLFTIDEEKPRTMTTVLKPQNTFNPISTTNKLNVDRLGLKDEDSSQPLKSNFFT